MTELKSFGGREELIYKMISGCDGHFEEEIKSIVKMHDSANDNADSPAHAKLGGVREEVLSGGM